MRSPGARSDAISVNQPHAEREAPDVERCGVSKKANSPKWGDLFPSTCLLLLRHANSPPLRGLKASGTTTRVSRKAFPLSELPSRESNPQNPTSSEVHEPKQRLPKNTGQGRLRIGTFGCLLHETNSRCWPLGIESHKSAGVFTKQVSVQL